MRHRARIESRAVKIGPRAGIAGLLLVGAVLAACHEPTRPKTGVATTPSIDSVSPPDIDPGTTIDLTVTVIGRGFEPTSVVQWNGVARATKFVDDGLLEVTVPPADLEQTASIDVTVRNPTSSGVSPAAKFYVNPMFLALAAGQFHTCGITKESAVVCWGSNSNGQLGNGSRNASAIPVVVSGSTAFQSIAAGANETCGLTVDGSAFCWGENSSGQIGDGTQTDRLVPTRVAGGIPFTELAIAATHTCGRTATGVAYCWGSNARGALGDGTNVSHLTPGLVMGGLAFTRITAGGGHSCGVVPSRDAYCWGANTYGQLGNGTTTDRNVPALVSGGFLFNYLQAGAEHTCGPVTPAKYKCWGRNNVGQLGDRTFTDRLAPETGVTSLVTAAIGAAHGCGRWLSDPAFIQNSCWGDNSFGQLADLTTNNRNEPVFPERQKEFLTMVAGGWHTCALTRLGRAYCWGRNASGELGDATTIERHDPAIVRPPVR